MIVLVFAIMIVSTMAIASIMQLEEPMESSIDIIPHDSTQWIPSKEDIQYQDSMWRIINQTQKDVDIIKEDIEDILYKLDRIEYSDGTWDSIRTPISN